MALVLVVPVKVLPTFSSNYLIDLYAFLLLWYQLFSCMFLYLVVFYVLTTFLTHKVGWVP